MSRIVERICRVVRFNLHCHSVSPLEMECVFLCIYMPLKFPFGIISPEINAHKIYLFVTHTDVHTHQTWQVLYARCQRKKCAPKIPNDCFRVCLHFVSHQFTLSNEIWSDSSGAACFRCSHLAWECEKDVKRKTCIRTSYHNESKRILRQICLLGTEQMRFKGINWNKSLNQLKHLRDWKVKKRDALSFCSEIRVNWHLNSFVRWKTH